jgi:hypothetical protein
MFFRVMCGLLNCFFMTLAVFISVLRLKIAAPVLSELSGLSEHFFLEQATIILSIPTENAGLKA